MSSQQPQQPQPQPQQQQPQSDPEVRDQDRLLPIANVTRIMKRALPDNAKISKDAKETIQECVSEFVLFLSSEAADRCLTEKRKTISGEDLLWSLQTLGFDNYIEPLRVYLAKFRDQAKVEKVVPSSVAQGQQQHQQGYM
ncbi:hypothetical protein MP638_001813 [Amoeboaphelidium occidentale]|nr:hypothetical protein MP638_001813 [Amoeboaphelidium occidentale]